VKKNKVDALRLLAILTIIIGIFYFDANLFVPRLIPSFLRIGATRKPLNILILGTDLNFSAETRQQVAADGRTDSIVLMRVDPIHFKIVLFSIPRDSFVAIPGYGYNKINAANVFGGVELIKKAVSNLTGVHIDYYIKLNPAAVTDLVNLIGGINIYVEKDMYYVDRAQNLYINLKEGWHKLSGQEAQDYMRFRHDNAGDIGRIERQQKFMQTLFLNFASPSNLLKAPSAIIITMKHIQTDLSLSKLIRLVNFARMLNRSEILTYTATGEPGTSAYAGSILTPDRAVIQSIIKDHF
jgi:polyisoprenyl-teichoic acid--peptidoglycan teichoic acid transferase